MPTICIIGAGWAGLSCAYELAKAGHKIQLIEAAPKIGGRGRSINFANQLVDNGQHIAMGAYHNLRRIVKELSLSEQELFKILPLEIIAYSDTKLHLKLPKLPVPFNMVSGIITARNISWQGKQRILSFANAMQKCNFILNKDCSVLTLLQNYHQPSDQIERFWEPIALAALSTGIARASAQIFLNVLRQVFYTQANASNWYLPAVDLTRLLPTQIANFLHTKDCQIIYQQAIKKISVQADQTMHVYSNHQCWQSDHVVLATAPWQALHLLPAHQDLLATQNALSKFSCEPITTIYYQYAKPVALPYPMVGILNATCQWIFDRAFVTQPQILSAVITGPLHKNFRNQQALSTHVLHEISRVFPHLASPIASKVITEKRAAFTCDVAIQQHRPQAATALGNLWLTGDYLQTGLPATLEGALQSGKQTAVAICERIGKF